MQDEQWDTSMLKHHGIMRSQYLLIKQLKVGTKKVIQDHSTIGIVVTSDGSISRYSMNKVITVQQIEIIQELQEIGKPFIVIVNSKDPSSSKVCQKEVERYQVIEYDVPVIAMDATNMEEPQIVHLYYKKHLYEFGIQ